MDLYGIKIDPPKISSYEEAEKYPWVPCLLGDIFVIYFPTFGVIMALREPKSCFTKKNGKFFTIANKGMDRSCALQSSTFAFTPIFDWHWKMLKDMENFHNFDIQEIGTTKQNFIFNDVRTIIKNAEIAKPSDIAFCYDVFAQIYFLLYLASRTKINKNFPFPPS